MVSIALNFCCPSLANEGHLKVRPFGLQFWWTIPGYGSKSNESRIFFQKASSHLEAGEQGEYGPNHDEDDAAKERTHLDVAVNLCWSGPLVVVETPLGPGDEMLTQTAHNTRHL